MRKRKNESEFVDDKYMSIEYGLITADMAEKLVLKTLNDKLKYFFAEIIDK